jgi:nucleoside-diphosphate-sugar epimerase
MKKRVLVTGSEGFTGTYVCNEFARAGWEVWGAGAQSRPHKTRYLQMDLLKPNTLDSVLNLARPNVVIHLAASAFAAESDPAIFYQTNFLGTKHLLDALCRAELTPTCSILASSATVYGNPSTPFVTEKQAVKPLNHYAMSKLAMEYVAKSYMQDLGIVLARPFNYTGIGQDTRFLIPKIVNHYIHGAKKIELGNLNVAREFCDVRDISRYYLKIAEIQPAGITVNLCSGQAHTLSEVLEMASNIYGSKLDISINPKFVRQNDPALLCGDRSILESLIGKDEPIHVIDTLRWMLNEKNK